MNKKNDNVTRIFKVIRKEQLSQNDEKVRFLYTIDFVYKRDDLSKIKNYVFEKESYIFIKSKYNLSLGKIYEAVISSASEKFYRSYYDTLIEKRKKINYTVFSFHSKPKKYEYIDKLIFFSDISEDKISKPELSALEEKSSFQEVRVYNVKQGNMNTVHTKEEVILYDWGTDIPALLTGSPSNLNESDISTIILSHHHFDHYSIFINKTFSNLKTIFIPNGLVYGSMLNFWSKHKKTKFIVIPLSTPRTIRYIGKYSVLDLYIGPQMSSKSTKNNECIIVNIPIDDKIKSLTGDIYWYLYIQSLKTIPISKKIDFVVPHHGGDIGKSSPMLPYSFDRAIYSYGIPNRHGHPSTITISMINGYAKKCKYTHKIKDYDYYIL